MYSESNSGLHRWLGVLFEDFGESLELVSGKTTSPNLGSLTSVVVVLVKVEFIVVGVGEVAVGVGVGGREVFVVKGSH